MAMKYSKTFFWQMFDKGGVLAVGIACFYFQRRRYIPDVFGPISYGIISVGAIAIGRHIIMHLNMFDKPKDTLDQTWNLFLEEMEEKSHKVQQERRNRGVHEELHVMQIRKLKEKTHERKLLAIFSQAVIEFFEKEIELTPERRDFLQQYLRGFEMYFQFGFKVGPDYVERSDDFDLEIINKDEIKLSGFE